MSTLVFDIETVGEKWETFDETTKHVLSRWVEKTSHTKKELESQLEDLKNGLGFSPLTGFIVAIGVYDIERERGVVYYTADKSDDDFAIDNFIYKQRSEKQMLIEFWEGAKQYDTFVTFNGRAFDAPFIFHRSLVHDIAPSRNLLEGRYPSQQKITRHVDLQDELTFFGAMVKRPSLHLFCRAYGILSPKQEVSGDDVAELFQLKKFRDIALYNAKDVIATTELYKKWQRNTANNKQAEDEIDF